MGREIMMSFSDEMVRAILAGRKTQTRRVLKPQPEQFVGRMVVSGREAFSENEAQNHVWNLPYQVGDRIGVRECWQAPEYEIWRPSDIPGGAHIVYRADYTNKEDPAEEHRRWKPSIHMPRWMSRISLEVIGVRIERLYDISEADAIAEGIESRQTAIDTLYRRYDQLGETTSAVHSFGTLWESIYGRGSFDSRWVTVTEFNRGA